MEESLMEEGPFKPNCSLSETLQKKTEKALKQIIFLLTQKRDIDAIERLIFAGLKIFQSFATT